MRILSFLAFLFFLVGCTYMSKTTLNAQAGKLVSPYGVLTNGTMTVTREMSWGKLTNEDCNEPQRNP